MKFSCSLLWILISFASYLRADSLPDSLLDVSISYFDKANSEEKNYRQKLEWAKKAEEGFALLKKDSFLKETKFIIASSAYHLKDSAAFVQVINPLLEQAIQNKDTANIVRSYNNWGSFYFTMGETKKGIESFKYPDEHNYYSESAIEHTVYNLGALIDISLYYLKDLDLMYYYVNRLQKLSRQYTTPSLQIVSRFKLAQLLSEAGKAENALNTLREAYPYLNKTDDKGFLNLYYQSLVNSFIETEQADSAYYYLDVLQEVTSYAEGDPRNCYVIVSRLRSEMSMRDIEILPDNFNLCYDSTLKTIKRQKRAGAQDFSTLYVKSKHLFSQKKYSELDEVLEVLIQYANKSQDVAMLVKAYNLRYESLDARGRTTEALRAHVQLLKHTNALHRLSFSQSQNIISNQLNLELAAERNRILAIENQNQKLEIDKDRGVFILFILGFIILGLLITYFSKLSRDNARESKKLEMLVKQRTEELENSNAALLSTNKELTESNTELERFTFIASHDLKTPLHNMINFAGLLERKLKKEEDKEVKDYLSYILEGGKRMNMLIEDVLEFSKLSKKNTREEKKAVNLNSLTEEAKRSVSGYSEYKNAALEVPESLPTLYVNPAKVFILFKNLIENGIKYNESENPRITITHEVNHDALSIFVEDNGIGIKKEFHDRIFTMFSRLHNYSDYAGSGLGLSICKKVVEELNGKIGFTSVPGEGTVFRIDLPAELLYTPAVPSQEEMSV